jgi:hypothetical protein
VAAIGGAAALVVAALLRRPELEEGRGPLVALAAALFVAPVAWHGLARLDPPRGGAELPAGLMHALRKDVPEGDVVFADTETSYLAAAAAPVYVAAAPPAHVADTKPNRPQARQRDVARFLRSGDLAIPRRYGATFLLVNRRRSKLAPKLPRLYADSRYALYRL